MVKRALTDPHTQSVIAVMVHEANSMQNLPSSMEMLPLILLSYARVTADHCAGKRQTCALEELAAGVPGLDVSTEAVPCHATLLSSQALPSLSCSVSADPSHCAM